MKSELYQINTIWNRLDEEFEISLDEKMFFEIDLKKINSNINTVEINEQINTYFLTSTSIDDNKIDNGWTDSGKTITFSEALSLLG